MKVQRIYNGFIVEGKYQTVRVEMVVFEGKRQAAIYESKDNPIHPVYIEPLHDNDLFRMAYRIASMSARFELHSHE